MVMPNSGGFAVTRNHVSDRFYNPPPVRRQQQLLLQQQLQRALKSESRVDSSDPDILTDSEESTLSRPNSTCSSSSPRNTDLTNLDRLMESFTPVVPALLLSETRARGWRACEVDGHPFFSLGDLWESFKEWSVYGVGVPLLLNGSDSVKQYYVPFLSGIQLYIDPHRQRLFTRRPGEDSDAGSPGETCSAGSSDCEAERQSKNVVDGARGNHNLISLNSQRMRKLTLREKPANSSSNDEPEVYSSPELPIFEYFEQEQPHHRRPLYDKVSNLASQFPELLLYRSYDLLPTSWVSVAWYPIYRIPIGPTLQNLDASFLTFHSLSTHSISAGKNQSKFHASSGRKVDWNELSSKISLPLFGLASYKLRGSIFTPSGANECQQANSLLQAAGIWLQQLQVNLPDFQFFVSHGSQWR
ncbi:hypothetical protein I3760_07G111600 [Carya illinoinensis]|uniref:DUF789 domain-containing protein n=1 Tax=Carya illinoinensis TaxID=32201 RepID=A0A922JD66_CARIL|nr:hypothetical protein I3760_07G111600 [Carya illinoinensis]KAG6704031.1 hypothetical protein I3842_07G115800 [Carya illinoinensis]